LSDSGVPFARLRKLNDLAKDPQAVHNQLFREIEHPVAGNLRETRPAARFSESPAKPAGFAPVVGEHTEAVLAMIGRSDKLKQLVADGIVGVTAT
jgi:crotonobetainyl-CoA:carnitine CoA-transferase CaiB-like acyl-CoA transferase